MKFVLSKAIDGTMQLKAGEVAQVNRRKFCLKQGIDYNRVVAGQLANGNNIAVVMDHDAGSVQIATDGLITKSPNIYLSISVADCLPVVLYSKNKMVALLHCGWRGLDLGIIEKAVKMLSELEIQTSDISVLIGPGIERHHYSVGENVAAKFEKYPGSVIKSNGEILLDLKAVARQQLVNLEIENIEISPVCTYCDQSCFSARRDRKEPVEAMMVIVSL